ncbi:hypothetical protein H4R18_002237 [Coemansia javaensis]|uniref:Uncharacterized protein n=1 Tax=Coemansia javaensis TaxID=2761396 RepID=A0A9W8LJF7_9FUNG|nr:hypothetical protein H4R18_002237 [Coemansia javaensis]
MEFSQRPAPAPLSGAHGFITAAAGVAPPAHYSPYPPQPAAPYAAYAQPAPDAYGARARRLPSVSELLVSPDAGAQQQYAPHQSQPRHYPPRADPAAYSVDAPAVTPHRNSASSTSSHVTLVDKHSPVAYHLGAKAAAPAPAPAPDRGAYEDDVFMAANILMSLRACKVPC